MQIFAKAILVSILVTVSIMMFTSLVFFFPWYTTVVVETFSLSQIAASDNYVKQSYYNDVLTSLKDRPFFREKTNDIEIKVLNSYGLWAVGDDDETTYYDDAPEDKPYCQRGDPLIITIEAVYPLKVTIWGETIDKDIPVSFTLKTIGLKHYKDLPYYY